jgi:aspartyl-tRNA(Asn)/glutamyl-tRNA(Gln) amidotransferase subunit C
MYIPGIGTSSQVGLVPVPVLVRQGNRMSQKEEVKVDEKLVREIAALARLDLTEEETKTFIPQFQDILKYFSILNELDTEHVAPAYLSSANKSVTREDNVEESVPTQEFLANAPQAKDEYVVIPRVHIEQ